MTSGLPVVDLQQDVTASCPDGDRLVATVARLADRPRRHGAPVVLVQHGDDDLPPGSPQWQLDARPSRGADDVVVGKTFRDAFAGTELLETLRGVAVDRLVVVGAHSDYCVQTTALSALAQGFDLVLVSDGRAAEPTTSGGVRFAARTISDLVNARMSTLRYPGRTVQVLPAAQVSFG